MVFGSIFRIFLYIIPCHLQTVTVLLLPFQLGFLLFRFLLWLPWLGLPKLCWIKVARVDILVLFLIRGNSFTVENDICCGFVIYGLYYVEVRSLYAHFLERFYHKWVLNFVKTLLASIEMIIWFLILQFVNMVYHIDLFVYIEESLYPWDKSDLIMVYKHFNVLLGSVC